MTIDKTKFSNNKIFVMVTFIAIIIFILLSIIFKDNSKKIYESELEENGENTISKLVINEYMSSNKGTIVDDDGNSYDWIELYNGTSNDINLINYVLTDNENKIKFSFPNIVISKNSYMIIYLSGERKNGLYAPFKLKSGGGETIALKKSNGKVVDIVKTVALTSNQSAARNLNGDFIVTSMPTPGYPNTKEGFNELTSSIEIENNGIRISEVLAKNDGNFSLSGKYPGYIEVLNTTDKEVSIDGYYLSNDITKLYKYKIENIVLGPNQAFVVYTGSNVDDEENSYLTFNLDNKFGKVYLSNKDGKIIDKIEYESLPNGVALVLIDENYYETNSISPGYSNTKEGEEKFINKYLTTPKTLLINEIMNNNTSYLAQNGYNFYDWIELYNNSNENVNLSDYTLTTSMNNKTLYKLPEKELKPGEYYVIMASGDTNLSNNSYEHANFKLSDTENLYLYKDNKIIDSMVIYNVPLNYSYGRGEENGFFYMESPTPLTKNKVGVREISFAPTFSIEAGIYNDVENIKVELSGLGDIYYTLDGNTPTKYSKKYTEPIVLKKTTVIKAISLENGKIKSDVITKSYIINENHTLPVVSMSISSSNYQKVLSGYYDWSDVQAGGYLEFFEDGGSFSIPCSISLFGGTSSRNMAKKSYSIRFKSKYGAGSLNYKLFDNRDTSVYQSIVLRSGSQDYPYTFIKDIVGTSLVDDYTNVDVQAYKSAILYINGSYYGIYNIREKVNSDYIANHYNVDPDKVNMLQAVNKVQSGTKVFFNNTVNYVRTHNMSLDSSYEGLSKLIDFENFFDFWIAEVFTANTDIHNIRYFSHPDIDDGRIKMVFFDLDYAWNYYSTNFFAYYTNPNGIETFSGVLNTDILRISLRNSKIRQIFIERLKYNLENTWNVENVLKRIDDIYNKLLPEMERNQKRWGLTMSRWNFYVDKLKNFVEKRTSYVLQQARYFLNLTSEEYNKYFGGIL